MSGPGWGGDEIAIGVGGIHGGFDVGATCEFDFGFDGGICGEGIIADNIGGCENLYAMAYGGDGFVCVGEVSCDFEDFGVEADVFGGAATCDEEGVVGFGFDVFKGVVEGEVVAWLFGVGLIAFEVVDGCANCVAFLFVGADDMGGVAYEQEHLVGNHDFVIFDVVAGEDEDVFG